MPLLNHCDLLRHVGVNNLPKVVTWQRGGRELNTQPASCKSNALATRLPSHPYKIYVWAKVYYMLPIVLKMPLNPNQPTNMLPTVICIYCKMHSVSCYPYSRCHIVISYNCCDIVLCLCVFEKFLWAVSCWFLWLLYYCRWVKMELLCECATRLIYL